MMIKDERILSTKRQIASGGFGIWYFLLLASLLYRQFYLRQSVDQYWDIAATFFIGTFYVSISLFARGAVLENAITRSFKWTAPTILITIVGVSYFLGNINSWMELLATIVSAAAGFALVAIVFYALYRRWEDSIEST